MKLDISLQTYEKQSNIEFHENPFMGAQSFRTDGRAGRRTDMSKLIVAFRNIAKAPEKFYIILWLVVIILNLKVS
jgi:hypothetical protein